MIYNSWKEPTGSSKESRWFPYSLSPSLEGKLFEGGDRVSALGKVELSDSTN